MHEIFDKVTEFVWGVWRYRWTALITAWLLALAGWFMVAQIDARYPATARLFVDTNRILEPLLDGIAVQPNVKQRVSLMSKTLLSRPNMEKLIDEHQLDVNPIDGQRIPREDVIEALQDEINIRDVNGGQSIYSLSYSHQDARVAKAVVESLINIFVNSSLNEERVDNQTTQRFLDKQIEQYEGRLIAAERRLAEFKRKHAGSLPGEAGGYYKRMENLVGLERTASLELQEAINRRNTLSNNLAQEERKIVSSASRSTPYDARIRELQGQLDELLVRYTDRHPQVSILQQSIDDLRVQKLNSGSSASNVGLLLQESVVYQKLSTLLAEAEAEVAKLRARSSNYASRVTALRGTVDSIPQVEAELKQLDRDYETVREQHETLLNKREAARLTGNIERDSNDVKIQLLDPPFVPSRPTDPDRLVLNALTLIASITVGVLAAFFLSMLHPVFYNQRSLEHLTQLPVLGSVSLSQRPAERISSLVKHMKFTIIAVLLPIMCVGVVYLQLKNETVYDSFKLAEQAPVDNQAARQPAVSELAVNELD
jgi:polysaccharide chain length determinant protein (PEP-CTERM system associated)